MENICPVCEYNGLDEPPYNRHGRGSDEICPCCGFQFGLDDDCADRDAAYDAWRRAWARKGCQWFSNFRLPPADWDPIVLTLETDMDDSETPEQAK